MTVTTCVLFNHPYPDNIPILREIFSPRYRDLVFTQPLVRSQDPDVFTTYRGSYTFHGQIADIADQLLTRGSEYYIFVQDDVLLNPRFNDRELVERLGVAADGGFIPEVAPLGGQLSWWPWAFRTIWQTYYPMNNLAGSGVENLMGLLPDGSALRSRLSKQYGLNFVPLNYDRNSDFSTLYPFVDPGLRNAAVRVLIEGLFSSSPERDAVELPFPYCRAMSDFFVVGRSAFRKFSEMVGWFAAADIFAEVAIPTALLACAAHVTQARDVGFQVDWRWGMDRNAIEVNSVVTQFQESLLLVHPLKLSKDQFIVREILKLAQA